MIALHHGGVWSGAIDFLVTTTSGRDGEDGGTLERQNVMILVTATKIL